MLKNEAVVHLKKLLIDKEISPNNLALNIKTTSTRISEILRNRRNITADTDLRLCKFFKLTDGYFLKLQINYDLALTKEKISSKLEQIMSYDIVRKE